MLAWSEGGMVACCDSLACFPDWAACCGRDDSNNVVVGRFCECLRGPSPDLYFFRVLYIVSDPDVPPSPFRSYDKSYRAREAQTGTPLVLDDRDAFI